MNKPYVKQFENGVCVNPITKENPYLHRFNNTSVEKREYKNNSNNKKGVRMVVTNMGKGLFCKTTITEMGLFNTGGYRFRSNKVRRNFKRVMSQTVKYTK